MGVLTVSLEGEEGRLVLASETSRSQLPWGENLPLAVPHSLPTEAWGLLVSPEVPFPSCLGEVSEQGACVLGLR